MPTAQAFPTLPSQPIPSTAESLRVLQVRRRISGVLLLDKPVRMTSNHALQVVKRIFRAEKAGHAGTLDPLASGLLPIFLGEATRFSGYLLDADKGYEAQISLGVTTRTGDTEGEVLERRPVNVSEADLAATLQRFLGAQTQVPPMYSALKRDGTPLYVLARRGETVERAPRTIKISVLRMRAFNADQILLDVTCSKGTYIRTLAEDIGAALGCGAHLSGLRRTATGSFLLAQSVALDALMAMTETERDALLKPADAILGLLPEVELDERAAVLFCFGQVVFLPDSVIGVCRVYAPSARFLGLGEVSAAGRLAPKRLLGEPIRVSPTS